MTPTEMRLQGQARILKIAEDAGWQAVVEIEGYNFEAYLSAEGACEQYAEGKLSQAEQVLTDLGGPELYPAVEEYDVSEPAEGHDPGLPDEPVAEEDDPRPEEDRIAHMASLPTLAAGEAEGAGAEAPEEIEHDPKITAECEFGDGLYTVPNVPQDLRSPKELYQATQVKDQDHGGIPRPTQVTGGDKMSVAFNGEQFVAPENHHIEARKSGFKTRQYGRQVSEAEKQRMVVDHWFFYAVKNEKAKKALLAGGAITVENRRFVASEGHEIVARKGELEFAVLSLNTNFKKAGWSLSARSL